jgi:hypothetical protein
MTNEEHEPEEQELRQAAALAAALDRGQRSAESLEQELLAAAMLSTALGPGLGAERSDALLEELVAGLSNAPKASRLQSWSSSRIWISLLPAGLAAVLVAIVTSHPAPQLPPPSRSLLEAQLGTATRLAEAETSRVVRAAAYVAELRDYRRQVVASLRQRIR